MPKIKEILTPEEYYIYQARQELNDCVAKNSFQAIWDHFWLTKQAIHLKYRNIYWKLFKHKDFLEDFIPKKQIWK